MSENVKNYFFWNKEAFQNSVKKNVCPRCRFVNAFSAGCSNSDPKGCSIFRYLPDFVRVAQRIKSADAREYEEAVRQEIPLHCEHAGKPGSACNWMDSPSCGLSELLPHVLTAVLETDNALEKRFGSEM